MKDQKARSAPKKQRTPARASRPAQGDLLPAGLLVAFKLIAEEGESPWLCNKHARLLYPHAAALATMFATGETPSGRNDDVEFHEQLKSAACRMWVNEDEEVYAAFDDHGAGLMSITGFKMGVAVCWLMMHAMNGGSMEGGNR